MRRREFIAGLGVVAWPFLAAAQQPQLLRHIGVLWANAESDQLAQSQLAAIMRDVAHCLPIC
jgi:hypothetical protein